MPTLIEYDRLLTVADIDASRYIAATPFPHIVMHDFLAPEVAAAAMKAFPSPESMQDWRRADASDTKGRIAQSHKLGYSNLLRLPNVLRDLLYELNGSQFLRYLEAVTGIPNLIPDPHLTGGGLHQYLPDAVLRVHADFNKLGGMDLDRRLNLLIYLNENWREEWGGELELWDREMRECVIRIPPLGNTCVIFSTTSTSYHGMPDPLRCPAGITRRSLALYYYTNGRPEYECMPAHSTLWQARPHEVA